MLFAPVFVVGFPRSGSTLLQSLLSANNKTYSLPETHFFVSVLPYLSKSIEEMLDSDELGAALSILERKMALQLTAGEKASLQRETDNGSMSAARLFEFVVARFHPVDAGQSLRVIEKTPLHALYMDEILSAYGEAKFVHIIRDPRAAISSVLQTPFFETTWLPWHIHRWNLIVETASSFSARHPNSLFSLKYEDLISMPEEMLETVCQFLELEYSAAMLTEFSTEWAKNVISSEVWKIGDPSGRVRQNQTAWMERCSAKEAWIIEKGTQKFSSQYRYDRQVEISPQQKIEALRSIWQRLRNDHLTRQRMQVMLVDDLERGRRSEARNLAWGLLTADFTSIRKPYVRAALHRV